MLRLVFQDMHLSVFFLLCKGELNGVDVLGGFAHAKENMSRGEQSLCVLFNANAFALKRALVSVSRFALDLFFFFFIEYKIGLVLLDFFHPMLAHWGKSERVSFIHSASCAPYLSVNGAKSRLPVCHSVSPGSYLKSQFYCL